MLRALTVAVECPSAYNSTEAHILRRTVAMTSKADLCRRASQLLPEVPGHFMTGKPLPSECLAAHRRCGADPSCSATVGRMVRSSASVKHMLDDVLGLCGKKQSMLLAMEVSYECPGMLPAKEGKESHQALAMVPPLQLCEKMAELTQVMGIMLSPMPSAACSNAKRKCSSLPRCAKAQSSASGDEKALMTEALAMCDDRDSMMATLLLGEECEAHPQVLGQARAALTRVPPPKLCEESKAFMKRLGANPYRLDAQTSMSATIPPLACTEAQERCGASSRCSSVALEIESQSHRSATSNGQMLKILQLCGNRRDFFAALDLSAECPGNSLQEQMRSMQQALRNAPEASLCTLAMSEAQSTILKSAPLALPPVSCLRAHTACSLDSECTRVTSATSGLLTNNVATICGNRHSFSLALLVAVECPGPQPNSHLRTAMSSLTHVPDNELCDVADQLLRRSPEASKGLESVKAAPGMASAFEKAVEDEATSIANKEAASLVNTFDRAPHDGRLNALELEALLAEARVQAKMGALRDEAESNNVLQLILPALRELNLKAIDFLNNGFVEPVELAAVLMPHLKASLSGL